MAFVARFFHLLPPVAEAAPLTPPPAPFHDNDACAVGQEIKASGEWQLYEPTRVAETRACCPRCTELANASPQAART
ncbi:MAG: hypothetical protein ACRYFK_01160 [Janthinobacterium lividum]